MKRFKVDASFDLMGGFWTAGQPNSTFAGTLRSELGSLKLTGAPEFGPLDVDSSRREMEALFRSVALAEPTRMLGFTTECPCTLLGVFELNNAGLTDHRSRIRIAAKQYQVRGAILGFHLDPSGCESISSAVYYISDIEQWLPKGWNTRISDTELTYHLPIGSASVFSFSSAELGAEVRCEVSSDSRTEVRRGASIKSVPLLKIIPSNPRSIEWYTALAFRLENFFALCLGTSVRLQRFQVFQGATEGWVVRKFRGRRERPDFSSWLRCSAQDTAAALKKWLSVPEERLAVERTLLGMLRKTDLFSETEFLSLAQALEGFGRISFTFSSARPRYRDLIGKSYDLLTPRFAFQLLGERESFIQKVVKTRNYYTHLGTHRLAEVVDDPKELFLLNRRLLAFLRCVMLIDLGISEDDLVGPITDQATKWV